MNGIYVLSANDDYVEKTGKQENISLWHARLTQDGYERLKEISSDKLVEGLPSLGNFNHDGACEGCQYGKAHRLPFGSSIVKSKEPLQLIHSDLLGPCRTASLSRYYYMLVIVDDFFRYSWVCSS